MTQPATAGIASRGIRLPSPGDVIEAIGGAASDVWTGISSTVREAIETSAIIGGVAASAVARAYDDLMQTIGVVSTEALARFLESNARDLSPQQLIAIQVAGGVSAPGRRLTAEEREALKSVYGDSIDYDAVVIREGEVGFFNQDDRPVTLGNTILVPSASAPLPLEVLVHEFGHVWQYQHGGTDYLAESAATQLRVGADAYDFVAELERGTSWAELGAEMQAELLQEAYAAGIFDDPDARFIVDGQDYTAYVRNAIREVRSGRGAP